jgi:hypothetical protein
MAKRRFSVRYPMRNWRRGLAARKRKRPVPVSMPEMDGYDVAKQLREMREMAPRRWTVL